MNPALMMHMYINKNGKFDQQAYNDAMLNEYYQHNNIAPPNPNYPLDLSWVEDAARIAKLPVPGSLNQTEAPQLPPPQPVIQPPQPMIVDNELPDDSAENIQQEVQQQAVSPIAAGAQDAFIAREQSGEISEQQRQRAMGLAAMGFFSNYASSQNPSNLGAINESFNPAVQAYVNERDKMLDENYRQNKMEIDEQFRRDELEYRERAAQARAAKTTKDGLTQYQQFQMDKHRRSLNSDYLNLQKRKDLELANYSKALKGVYGEKKLQALEKKKAEIDKKYRKAEQNFIQEGKRYGLDFEGQTEAIDNAVNSEFASQAAPATAPGTAIDFSQLSEEDLKKMGAR